MPRVVIDHVDKAPIVDGLSVMGVSRSGVIETKAVIRQEGRPILLWQHAMAPSAELRLDKPMVDHGFYVQRGAVDMNGTIVEADSFIAGEHMGQAVLRAGPDGADLLHFHRPDQHPEKPARAGGHVHAVGTDGILRVAHPDYGHEGTLWADAACPTCELWLHKSEFDKAKPAPTEVHYHSSDEIIFVLKGEMLVGNQKLSPGSALAIDRNTRYGFGVGEPGLSFLNFRPRDSFYVEIGETTSQPLSEREQWRTAVIL